MTPIRELELEQRWRSDFRAALRDADVDRGSNRFDFTRLMALADSVLDDGRPRTRERIHSVTIDAMLEIYA